MKNTIKYISILVFVFGVNIAFAQAPPPPNNGTTGSGGTTPVGGGAPIGGGIMILATMGLVYGFAKFKFGGSGVSGFDEMVE